jgi:hypothetical protein
MTEDLLCLHHWRLELLRNRDGAPDSLILVKPAILPIRSIVPVLAKRADADLIVGRGI